VLELAFEVGAPQPVGGSSVREWHSSGGVARAAKRDDEAAALEI
jgi:hypothetical protein